MMPESSSAINSSFGSDIIHINRKPRNDLFEPTGRRSGEASWDSFTRIVQYSCSHSLRFKVAEGDADRCPSDLSNVPMHVSLRDIVVMGLDIGMRIPNDRSLWDTQFNADQF